MENIITPGLALKAAVPGDDRRGGALTTNNTVSETNKFGVDAVELNPNIEGSMAHDIAEVNSNLTNSLSSNGLTAPIKFGYDSENDVYGYIKAGADTVTPFKNGNSNTYVSEYYSTGAWATYDLKNIVPENELSKINVDNVYIETYTSSSAFGIRNKSISDDYILGYSNNSSGAVPTQRVICIIPT